MPTARFQIIPVIFCRGCGKPLYPTVVETYQDPKRVNLDKIVHTLAEKALCAYCTQVMGHYGLLGPARLEDFMNGRP